MGMDPGKTAKERIAVIDDEEVMRISCKRILQKAGYGVDLYEDGVSGLEGIDESQPELVIVDLKMPEISGVEVIRRLKDKYPDMVIVVITGYATVESAVDSMKAGAYDFLPKPFTPDEFRLIVRRALERRRLAVEADRLKREKEAMERRFITFVSHQLQSPLSAVEQYLRVLLHLMGDKTPPEQREWIERSLVRVGELSTIIRDWLTLSRVERELISSKRVPVRVDHLMAELVATYGPRAQESGLTLSLNEPEELPSAAADPDALKMAFSNLIDNAIKFNRPQGSVSITSAADGDSVKVSVSDTGIGIPKENQEHIFEEFSRVKDESTRKIGGTGLGLSICKRIVDELGGKIELDSHPGQGTTFTVTLPIYPEGVQYAEEKSDGGT